MDFTLAHIGAQPGSKDGFDALTRVYLRALSAFARCQAEAFRHRGRFVRLACRRKGRTQPIVVLLDSRGRSMTSEAFAVWLVRGETRAPSTSSLPSARPTDGPNAVRQRANLLLSLGAMTLAHLLARLVLAEQVYRAFTILSGHPYHGGHWTTHG